MPKTIKELFEVYKPKSPDEQKFVDKHVTIKHKDRNGNDDDVFNATKIKPIKRKEERHGYDSGEDEKVYEDLEISDEELVFELDEEVEALEEGTVYYKHYTITSHPKVSGASEGGDIKHVFGHPKKMGNLDIEHDDTTDYGTTRRVTVKNSTTGETTHHHVYQSERSNSKGKPTLSIRTVGKAGAQQDKHANVIAHYLSGKTKLKEDTDLAFFDGLLEMNLDEDTFTDASLAQLRVMKHKQKMKEIESSSKTHPLMKVRKLSDAKKKLAELEAARDKLVAAHEKSQAKKKVTEEVEELDEGASRSFGSAIKKAEASRQRAIKRAGRSVHKGQSVENAIRDHDLFAKDKDAVLAHAASLKKVAEEVEELDELSRGTLGRYVRRAVAQKDDLKQDALHASRLGHDMKNLDNNIQGSEKMFKRAGELINKSINRHIGVNRAIDRLAKEEVESIDEGLMHDRYLRSHGKKARGTGAWAFTTKQYGSPKENEMHFTSGQKSLSDAHKEAAAKLGTKHLYVMEEVEELDELSKGTMGNYIKKAKGDVRYAGKQYVRSRIDDDQREMSYADRLAMKRYKGINMAVDKLTKEEVEELDELSFKKLVDYTAKSADSVSGAPVRKQDNRIKGQSLADKKIRKMDGYSSDAKVAATNEEVEELDELSNDAVKSYMDAAKKDRDYHQGAYQGIRPNFYKDGTIHKREAEKRQKGIDLASKKLTKEDIINRAIEKYMPEDYVAPSLDEQFIAKIDHLAEGHAVTLLALFDSLNEENKKTMLETVDTQEGVNSLLDFAIKNRGE